MGIAQYRQKCISNIYAEPVPKNVLRTFRPCRKYPSRFFKVFVSGSTEQNNKLFSDISRQSFQHRKIKSASVTHSTLNKTSKFTSTADYSSSMVKK